jgi:hypothetical protein
MADLSEHCCHLDLAWLRRQKLLTPGTSSSVNRTTGGRPSGSIRIEVGMDAVRLIYRTRTPGEDRQDMREVVRLQCAMDRGIPNPQIASRLASRLSKTRDTNTS